MKFWRSSNLGSFDEGIFRLRDAGKQLLGGPNSGVKGFGIQVETKVVYY
jgi:hypothetical protein